MPKITKSFGWGRYPVALMETISPLTISMAMEETVARESFITRGMGRSYGDSSLSDLGLGTTYLNRLISFDPTSGLLTCEAGVTLAEILDVFVPKGWFLPVTPGTKFISIGGAIASDVHGKNHHKHGTISQYIDEIQLILGNGEFVRASKCTKEDLFHATCGGMGLTGIIIAATIQLISIESSEIIETSIKTSNIDETLDAFEENEESTYSVAWVDCLATGINLGRSIISLGEHSHEGGLVVPNKNSLSIPLDMPNWLLSKKTLSAFNFLYYNRKVSRKSKNIINYDPYFYPLDKLIHWNKLYGKSGFIQYQFVIPKDASRSPLKAIMKLIAASGRGSFLAVLKSFGPANNNYLSFPIKGYTFAIDFKIDNLVFDLLDKLDEIVIASGGRLYLTKDARMSEETFKKGYPDWFKFQEIRSKYYALGKFNSMQSKRLGLE